jgi:hypothetical protein
MLQAFSRWHRTPVELFTTECKLLIVWILQSDLGSVEGQHVMPITLFRRPYNLKIAPVRKSSNETR